jgi:hypothetical protein
VFTALIFRSVRENEDVSSLSGFGDHEAPLVAEWQKVRHSHGTAAKPDGQQATDIIGR